MRKQKKILVNIEIDKLTNSIENAVSGDVFDTDIFQLFAKDSKQINKADWQFKWQEQVKLTNREVYKLVIKDNQKIIQGLISLSYQGDHIYMHLIENAKFNPDSYREQVKNLRRCSRQLSCVRLQTFF